MHDSVVEARPRSTAAPTSPALARNDSHSVGGPSDDRAAPSASRRRATWQGVGGGILLFIAVNAAVIALEPHLFRVNMYRQEYTPTRIADYAFAPPPDVIFMGSSRAAVGFDPAVTEALVETQTGVTISALNLGLYGAYIERSYLLLKNIIRDDKKPKVIVYQVTESEFGNPGENDTPTTKYFDVLLRPDDFWEYSGASLDSKANFLIRRAFPLYRNGDIIREDLSLMFNPDDPFHEAYASDRSSASPGARSNGYRSIAPGARGPRSRDEGELHTYAFLKDLELNAGRLARLRELIALAQRRGIQVVLVNLPVEREFRALWGSEERVERYRATIRSIARQMDVPLVDMYDNDQGRFGADAFYDVHHLNATGAAIATYDVTIGPVIDLLGLRPRVPLTSQAP